MSKKGTKGCTTLVVVVIAIIGATILYNTTIPNMEFSLYLKVVIWLGLYLLTQLVLAVSAYLVLGILTAITD